jgi:hypothetical protein
MIELLLTTAVVRVAFLILRLLQLLSLFAVTRCYFILWTCRQLHFDIPWVVLWVVVGVVIARRYFPLVYRL